jgi:hypothetical protein
VDRRAEKLAVAAANHGTWSVLSAEKKRRSGNLSELPQRDFARLRGQRLANFPAIVGFSGEFPSTSTDRLVDRSAGEYPLCETSFNNNNDTAAGRERLIARSCRK